MRQFVKRCVIAAALVALGIAGTAMAYADWTLPAGRHTVTANVVKMPRGTAPSVAKQAAKAIVSWSAQEVAPGVRMDHYIVMAHSTEDRPLRDVIHTIAATGGDSESVSFAAAEVAGGRWVWTIVPKFRLWTGAESGKSRGLTFPEVSAVPALAVEANAIPPATHPGSDKSTDPTADLPVSPTAPTEASTTPAATSTPAVEATTSAMEIVSPAES